MTHKLRRIRRLVHQCTGGFLPTPLAVRSTLVTAIIAAIVLSGFGHTLPGMIVGLLLAGAVWYMEIVETLTSKTSTLATHSRLSISYIAWLCVGFASLYSQRGDHLAWLEWVSLGGLAVAGWLVSAQPGFLDVTPLAGAANLKHSPQCVKQPRLQVRRLQTIVWVAVAASGVFAATPVTPWAILTVAAVVTGISVWSVAAAWRYSQHVRWGVLRELRSLNPTFMVAWASSPTYQVTMWEQYLTQLGEPHLIITLQDRTIAKLGETTDTPIICPADASAPEIAAITPGSVKTAFYVQNSRSNDVFLAQDTIQSLWLHHGDSDKRANFQKSHARYDYLFVAGQAAIDRYHNRRIKIPDDKFRIIGKPQASAITVDRDPIAHKPTPRVLYAPTWQGKHKNVNYSSLPLGENIVAALLRKGVAVTFRPHPAGQYGQSLAHINNIKHMLQTDRDQTGTPHVWDGAAEDPLRLVDNINASDALIADVSGVVTDFMQSGKPYAMVSPRWTADDFRHKFPTAQSAYVVDPSPGSIDAALDSMLGEDPLADYRWQRRAYYLGGYEGQEAVHRFLEAATKLM